MPKLKSLLKPSAAVVVIAVLVVSILVSTIMLGKARAGIPTSRKIFIASSAASATDVTYSPSFVTATTSNVQGLVVDFCSNSPIIGDSCTAPTGFDTNEAGPLALANQVGITDWVLNAATTANKVVLNRPGATSINSGVTISLDLGSSGGADGITNPSTTNTTYYARILTFTTTAGATGYASAVPGTYVDAGGVALSTANTLTITAKVQERLTFCIYTDAACNTPTSEGSTLTLGDANGVLDPSNNYVNADGRFDVATNAVGNAVIVMKGATLTSTPNTITAIGAAGATSSVGTEQFGMCLYEATGTGLTVSAPYVDAVHCVSGANKPTTGMNGDHGAAFAFDSAVTGTAAGDQIASKAPGTTSQGALNFIGNIAYATEAGIYTTTLSFIATGTY